MKEKEYAMSNVRDRNVIDLTYIEDDKYILVISDDIEWNYGIRQDHGRVLQDKINDYLTYVASGQAEEAQPGRRPVIRVVGEYPFSRYCLDFLERVRNFVKNKDDICDIEWTHAEEKEWNDGFSDDFVFDPERVYIRIKKNWAKDPANEVSLMAIDERECDYSNMPMYRYMDSFVYMFMQDTGKVFSYLTYDMLPEGIDIQKLQELAVNNMSKIQYRLSESKHKGIYGILAGGDFEAESQLFPELFGNVAEQLGGDLLISVPTKDIVFITKANDRKLVKQLLKHARNMFETNQKETPYLIFCKDIFFYSKKDGSLTIHLGFHL